jgi:murein DD-endopeptidase MepM/ murein hydrolase activator NlpD
MAAIPVGLVLGLFLASAQAPALAAGTPKFLTLPFAGPPGKVSIQRAWWTINRDTGRFDLLHHGIDYVYGKRDAVSTWQMFDALAAAPGDACAAKQSQGGCFDSGEIMGNRVLIKHKVDGKVYYTFYNHLDSIARNIPLNNIRDTVHVDQGDKIGVVGESNSPGFIHLHWELLDENLKPIDPYGIKGITDEYPDPKGKNGNRSGKNNYFTTNPPTVFGAVLNPTPGPSDGPLPSGAGESPGATEPAQSLDPGETPAPGESAGTGASPGASQIAVVGTPRPGASGSPTAPTGGSDNLPVILGVAALAALAVVLGLFFVSRRRNL